MDGPIVKNKSIIIPLLIGILNRGALFFILYTYLLATRPTTIKNMGFLNVFLKHWGRGDSNFYFSIAERGYSYSPERYCNIVFYPLYPLIIKYANIVFHSLRLTGVIISNLLFLSALVFLYKLAQRKFSVPVAFHSVLLISLYPFSFFYSCAYAESLFLLLSIMAFYYAEKNQWGLASFAGMFCSAGKTWGVLLFPVLLLLYLEKIAFDVKKIRANVLYLCLIPLGFLAFMGFLWLKFKTNPFLLIHSVESFWQRGLFDFSRLIYTFTHFLASPRSILYFFYAILIFIFGIFLIKMWRSLGPAYTVYSAIIIVFPLITNMQSTGRYLSTVFPSFMIFACYPQSRLTRCIIYFLSGAMLITLSIFFISGGRLY